MLSNLLNWNNQQYITMPVNDAVDTLGDAEALYDDKVSFVINDTEFGNRLALSAIGHHEPMLGSSEKGSAGGKASPRCSSSTD